MPCKGNIWRTRCHRRTYWIFLQDHFICTFTSTSMCLSFWYIISPFLLSYYPFKISAKLRHVHHHTVVESSLGYLLSFPLLIVMLRSWCHYVWLVILVTFIFVLAKPSSFDPLGILLKFRQVHLVCIIMLVKNGLVKNVQFHNLFQFSICIHLSWFSPRLILEMYSVPLGSFHRKLKLPISSILKREKNLIFFVKVFKKKLSWF